jgi:biopolymer transport protein ExbB/TolQ
MLDPITKILFAVSTGALVPVILALLAMAAWTLLLLGGLLSELLARAAARRALTAARSGLHGRDPHAAARQLAHAAAHLPPAGFLTRYLQSCWTPAEDDVTASRTVDDIELAMLRATARLSAAARLGPMLGLAGTLIPLGPGLVSMARGDVAGLAAQLVIAFSTTIVGLLVGVIAFSCAHIRRGWYAGDLADILFLEDIRSENRRAAA